METMTMRTAFRGIVLAVALPLAASAQQIPVDSLLRDFEPIGDYLLEIDGAEASGAEMYRSQPAGSAVLIVSPELDTPVLVSPRGQTVEGVPDDKLVRRDDGAVDILADADLVPHGKFSVEGADVVFSVDGHAARLEEKPYLLGLHGAADLLDYSAGYDYLAAKYEPSSSMIRQLREVSEPVRIRVYFGSWCPFCKQMVPRILSVAKEIEGSNIELEFYGLPSPFAGETAAKRDGITGVPTGIVYRGGREIGRIDGPEFKIPELAIKRVVVDG